MTTKTLHFRHVWRRLNTANGSVHILILQQWREAEGWEHKDIVRNGGLWEDVPVSTAESPTGPVD